MKRAYWLVLGLLACACGDSGTASGGGGAGSGAAPAGGNGSGGQPQAGGGAGGGPTAGAGAGGGLAQGGSGGGTAIVYCTDDPKNPDVCGPNASCVCGGPGGQMVCECGSSCVDDTECPNPEQPTCCGAGPDTMGTCTSTCTCLCD